MPRFGSTSLTRRRGLTTLAALGTAGAILAAGLPAPAQAKTPGNMLEMDVACWA